MLIEVVEYSNNKVYTSKDVKFILEQDDWNDFSYFTFYYLHYRPTASNTSLIGGVKIIKKRQRKKEKYLLDLGTYDKLPDDFCSMGSLLDYYDRISELDEDLKFTILNSMRDIINNPKFIEEYKDEGAFISSFLRTRTLEDDFFTLAPIILSKEFDKIPESKDFKFTFRPKSMDNSMSFDFSVKNKENKFYPDVLPNRVCVLVGRNGSGKSTILSKIARVAFSSTEERKYLKELGLIEPKGLGFPRIINISYSAFDSFQIPGTKLSEIKQIAIDIEKNKGRYIYCGIRDLGKELESELSRISIDKSGRIKPEFIIEDKYENNFLKSISKINNEILLAVSSIKNNSFKTTLLNESISILATEPSLNFLDTLIEEEFSEKILIKFISNISTGHKFVIHSITKMIHHIEKRSLVLFDEPESHLHPPLLAILMKTLRHILNRQNSYMIIATHSPVVVQETLKKNVLIIKREGAYSNATSPKSQTFGDSIGNITTNTFYLTSDYTDYHNDLDKIVEMYPGVKSYFDNYINDMFDNDISMQAYAYMISKFNEKDSN